jgi:hypothetical protein
MKKAYQYTINGNKYEVTIGEIEGLNATVIVNGEEYKVEMEPEPEEENASLQRLLPPLPPTMLRRLPSTPTMPSRLRCPVSSPLSRWP